MLAMCNFFSFKMTEQTCIHLTSNNYPFFVLSSVSLLSSFSILYTDLCTGLSFILVCINARKVSQKV